MRNLQNLLLSLLCMSLSAEMVPAQTEPEKKDNADERSAWAEREVEEAKLEARVININAELETLDRKALPEDHWAREWAGTYYTGDGLGMNVRINIAPESGVTYTWNGCLGLYGYNYGEITEVMPDGLALNLHVAHDESRYDFLDERLYFVKWGTVRFLVPEKQMLKFVNNYNRGGHARSSMYGIPVANAKPRWGAILDSGPPVYGPILPEPWAKMLLAETVTLTVTSIDSETHYSDRFSDWRHRGTVHFDAGDTEGVYVGLEFKLKTCYITITEVDEHSCVGTLWGFAENEEEEIMVLADDAITLPN